MSFRNLLNRRVSIEHVAPRAIPDAHGVNAGTVTGTETDVPAARQLDTTEETEGRSDRVITHYVYFFAGGQALGDQDRIIDTDGTYRVEGDPSSERGRRGEHHIEAKTKRVRG